MFFSKRFKTYAAAVLASFFVLVPFSGSVFAASYKVAKGDSLYTISKLFGTTAESLKKNNGLSGDTIYPGQVLDVPSDVYTVKSGDTLYLIAKKNGVSLSSLRKANNRWSDLIYPGEKLIIPRGNSASGNTGTSSGTVISYTASEFDLLARLVMAEAENQPYSAKVGVAAVVVNRVKSKEFPNTISAVINQKISGYYQFTPVENGWINRAASQEAKNAAYEALKGSDPSKGALFYFDDSSKNKWLWSKPVTAWIGNMVFVY